MKIQRLLLVIALFTLGLTLGTRGYAQTNDADARPAPITQSSHEKELFSNATDEQILEAQRFYKHCVKNETMNTQKDCRCAATAFLENRLNLGAQAPVPQIMDAIKNLCLTDPNAPVIEGERDMSSYSDAQLKDINSLYERCTNENRLRRRYDCACLAGKYATARKENPLISQDAVILDIGGACRNVVEMTGDYYTKCMVNPQIERNGIKEPKKFCECAALEYGNAIKKYDGKLSAVRRGQMMSSAEGRCMKKLEIE